MSLLPRSEEITGGSAAAPGAEAAHGRAMADLVREHNRALHAFLMTRVRNEHEAEEIAQEAYVRMLQLEKPGAISFLRAYLFKTAANIAFDRARDRARRPDTAEPTEEEPADELSPERRILGEEDYAIVRQALSELAPKCRRALLLCREHELTDAQIGEELGLQPRMVRYYLSRGALYCQLRVDGLSAEQAKAISG
jgi:RNA polymerase sigma-70 factor (ECF subfamily)